MFVTDTHPLIWYWQKPAKLSKKAKAAFDAAALAQDAIYVPTAVLWEMHFALRSGELELAIPFEEWIDRLLAAPGFTAQPLDADTIKIIHGLTFHNDPFDSAIVAAAISLGLPLITNDSLIHSIKPCKLYWD